MAYKRKTHEERMKEIEDLTNDMTEKIESYFVSEEALKEHLAFMSSFYNYSLRNMSLIDKQFPGARAVGSFNFWKEKGVFVKKGEKGIKILVPTPVEYFKKNNDWVQVRYANAKEKEQIKKGVLETRKKLFFKVGHVFEYTQTDAREKGLEVSQIFGQYHKDGEVENDKEMLEALRKISDKVGFKILDEPREELGTAKGAAYPYLKEIALNPRNTDYENVTTLIHELAHAKLHTPDIRDKLTTAEREFQAEMVSYVVANRYGIDTENFTLSYLGGWTEGKELKDKENLLNEVRDTAKEFIETIDEHMLQAKEKEMEKGLEKNHKLKVTSLEGVDGRDSEEIAQIVMTNGVTNKEHSFSVWASDISNNELSPYYVYLNCPEQLPDDYTNIQDALSDSLGDFTLSDLVKDTAEIEKSIQEYVQDENKTFSFEIPPNQQGLDLHSLIVDEEVADLLLKNEKSMVSKQDLIDFGRLVEGDKHFSYNLDHELNESFQVMLNQTGVKKDEVKYLNTAFNTLNVNLDANDFSKNKSIEKANEPEMTL